MARNRTRGVASRESAPHLWIRGFAAAASPNPPRLSQWSVHAQCCVRDNWSDRVFGRDSSIELQRERGQVIPLRRATGHSCVMCPKAAIPLRHSYWM